MPLTTAPAAVPESPVTLLPANVLSLNPTQRIAAMAALPPVILLKVLLVIVFLDPGVAPSALLQPSNVPVVPVRLMLEKLLPLLISVTFAPEREKAL